MRRFKGGVHPPECKQLTEEKPIRKADPPKILYIPVSQHIGAPGKPIVAKGDKVDRGQRLTEPAGFVSVPVHSPVSGVVKSIEPFHHPLGKKLDTIIIENDGEERFSSELTAVENWQSLSPKDIIDIAKSAGLAGMGGATFPTHVKLSPPEGKKIDTVILNGAECEPYLTADYRLMLEFPDEIIEGMKMIMYTLGAENGFVAIEDNKPEAVKILSQKLSGSDITVVSLRTKYPQGAEKQLIKALTGREVPSGGLPFDIGAYVQNVGTAKALFDAVALGIPLIERVVTVTGSIVNTPANLLVRLGTQAKELISVCDGTSEPPAKLIAGGPMMGIAQYTDEFPIIKGTSGILILGQKEATVNEPKPCIRCAKCVDVCPMNLVPTELANFAENSDWEKAEDNHILDCIECGSCSFVCPSERNLVQLIKYGKSEVTNIIRSRKQNG